VEVLAPSHSYTLDHVDGRRKLGPRPPAQGTEPSAVGFASHSGRRLLWPAGASEDPHDYRSSRKGEVRHAGPRCPLGTLSAWEVHVLEGGFERLQLMSSSGPEERRADRDRRPTRTGRQASQRSANASWRRRHRLDLGGPLASEAILVRRVTLLLRPPPSPPYRHAPLTKRDSAAFSVRVARARRSASWGERKVGNRVQSAGPSAPSSSSSRVKVAVSSPCRSRRM